MSSTHHGCSSCRVDYRKNEGCPGPNHYKMKLSYFLNSANCSSGRSLDHADGYPSDVADGYPRGVADGYPSDVADGYSGDVQKADHEQSMSECCNGVDKA